MNRINHISVLTVLLSLLFTSIAFAAPGRNAPRTMRHTHTTETLAYEVRILPGVAAVGKTAAIQVSISEVLGKHDATFGTRKPLDDARLTATLVSPGKHPTTQVRTALTMRDSGTYGFTFTSDVEGIHALYIEGKSSTMGAIKYEAPVSFGTWPMPEEIVLPPKPRKTPKAQTADLRHGKDLCYQYCKKDLNFALPQSAMPTFVESQHAAGLSGSGLVRAIVGNGSSRLTELQHNDLVQYIDTLAMSIQSFFPNAGSVMPAEFTLNQYALERFEESTRMKLKSDEVTYKVFVVYRNKGNSGRPAVIAYDDRVERGSLDRSSKLGYVVYMSNNSDPNFYEVGVAVGLEPTYPIVSVRSRNNSGQMDSKLNRQLMSFKGQGSFNDPRSLRRGSKSLQKKILPMYLTVAEVATMFFAAEREFNEFDSELDSLD
jgi:hypothetical protein